VALPPYPPQGERLEFSLGPASEFRFFIDAASLSVADGLVRYVLIARSPAGVENVTYEGLRCSNGEVRLYALGREGGWRGEPGAWRSPLAWHRELRREYFCSVKYPVYSREDALAALRR
jgi:CNP1-like family